MGFVLYFSTEWTGLWIGIHLWCLHFRSIVCLQFNELANWRLEINYKRKIKKNMLITISLKLLPRLGGASAWGQKQQPLSLTLFCVESRKGWEVPQKTLWESKETSHEYLGGKMLLERQWPQGMWNLESTVDWFILSCLSDSDNSAPVFPVHAESLQKEGEGGKKQQ